MVGMKNGTREAGLHGSFEEGGRVGLNRAHPRPSLTCAPLWNGPGSERARKSLRMRRFRKRNGPKSCQRESQLVLIPLIFQKAKAPFVGGA